MNQRDLTRKTTMIRLTGNPETVNGLTLRLGSDELGTELVLTTDAQGEVLDTTTGSPLAQLKNRRCSTAGTSELRRRTIPRLPQMALSTSRSERRDDVHGLHFTYR